MTELGADLDPNRRVGKQIRLNVVTAGYRLSGPLGVGYFSPCPANQN